MPVQDVSELCACEVSALPPQHLGQRLPAVGVATEVRHPLLLAPLLPRAVHVHSAIPLLPVAVSTHLPSFLLSNEEEQRVLLHQQTVLKRPHQLLHVQLLGVRGQVGEVGGERARGVEECEEEGEGGVTEYVGERCPQLVCERGWWWADDQSVAVLHGVDDARFAPLHEVVGEEEERGEGQGEGGGEGEERLRGVQLQDEVGEQGGGVGGQRREQRGARET